MKKSIFILFLVMEFFLLTATDCIRTTLPKSDSGVSKAKVEIKTNLNGLTTEQQNIIDRYKLDNTPGSIKHLYIISTYSGQVLLYSTVRGKVTSSGKRLTPTTVQGYNSATTAATNWVQIGNYNFITDEVLQDDGTYGTSIEYLYWFDSKGVYHQQYIQGGMMVHISDQPIAVKSIILNLETSGK